MEIKINAVGFSASSQLEDFIQKKISKLDKYHDGIIGSEVTLKLEKDDNLENKVVEVLLNVKGQEVFAKEKSKENSRKQSMSFMSSKASIGENQRERKRSAEKTKGEKIRS